MSRKKKPSGKAPIELPPIASTVVVVSAEEMAARCPPQHERGVVCAICATALDDFFGNYPGAVCHTCDSRALNTEGNPARHVSDYPESIEYAHANPGTLVDFGDDGDNPVFIDGHRCRRRYKFGGWVTMREVASSEPDGSHS
jgi:hypothetical protein